MKRFAYASAIVMAAAYATTPPPAGRATRSEVPHPQLRAALAHLLEEVRPAANGGLTIANASYRASFSRREGVVFTPRIDGVYDSRLTWQYRARAVERDGFQATLDAVEPVVSPAGDHVVDFARPWIIERYEGHAQGLEQIFVLAEQPPGRGDVRIRGEVSFAGERRRAGDALEFSGTGAAPLTYSKPVAFDAAQRPLPVRAELRGTDLDLVLEGDALQDARFPVTIDPLLGATTTYANGDYNGLGHYVDVAYNADRGEFLIVFDVGTAESDYEYREIRAKRFYDHGDAIGASYSISSPFYDLYPRVAYDLHTNTYLVVWNDDGNIHGRLLNSTGGVVGEEIDFGSGRAPAVAARNLTEHYLDDPSFLVAWDESSSAGHRIRRARLSAAGDILGAAPVNVTDLTGSAKPSVAYDPHADQFLVVWQDGAIRARAVSPGGFSSPEILVSNAYPETGTQANATVAFDPAAKKYFVVAPGAGWYRGYFLSSAATPAVLEDVPTNVQLSTVFPAQSVSPWPGGFVMPFVALDSEGGGHARFVRFRGDGDVLSNTHFDDAIQRAPAGLHSQNGFFFRVHKRGYDSAYETRVANGSRWFARYVHGGSGDFDGDGRSDLFVFRPASATFGVRTQTGTSWHPFDVPGGIPALLDWDGDARADLAVWKPSNGSWRIRVTATGAIETPALGRGGDIPVPGDYFGLGSDQIAVFRPSTGTWYIETPRSPTPVAIQFGQVGDMPVPADWNGDGDIELGVWRPSTGHWYAAETDGTPVSVPSTPFGQAGDTPLGGNFVGNSTADQVIYRRSNGTFYRRDGSTSATSSVVHFYGLPIPLDWDGNGRLDLVVSDPDPGTWYIGEGSITAITGFGTVGDIPAGAR